MRDSLTCSDTRARPATPRRVSARGFAGLFVVAATFSVLAPGAVANAATSLTAFVTNTSGGTVTPIDLATGSAGTPISVGSDPGPIVVSPDAATAYVGEDAGVATIDTASMAATGTIDLASGPAALVISPDGSTLYAAVGDEVIPIPTATDSPGTAITPSSGENVNALAISADGSTLYAAAGNEVVPIPTSSDVPGTAVTLTRTVDSLALAPDGATLYAAGFDYVDPINTSAMTAGSTFASAPISPEAMAITPDGATLYVADYEDQDVIPYTLPSGTEGTPIYDVNEEFPNFGTSQFEPGGMAVTPDGTNLYVVDNGDSQVFPVPVATNTPASPIVLSGGASGIAIAAVPVVTTPPGTVWTADAGASVSDFKADLNGVSCPTSSFCMAVGNQTVNSGGNVQPLAETWNGTSWSVSDIVNPSGLPEIDSVTCTGPTFCVAVGAYEDASTGDQQDTLVETYNGTAWSIVASANGYTGDAYASNTLVGVACTSLTFCVAVGSASNYTTSSVQETLTEVWNGATWSVSATPALASANPRLTSVSCVSVSFCESVGVGSNAAGGGAVAETWNGSSWSTSGAQNEPSGAGGLNGVSCATSTFCEAVGDYTADANNDNATMAETFNGSSWSLTSPPNPLAETGSNTNELDDVSCPSATTCEASGFILGATTSGYYQTLIEDFSSGTWQLATSPNAASEENTEFGGYDGNALDDPGNGVACGNGAPCFAVGAANAPSPGSSAQETFLAQGPVDASAGPTSTSFSILVNGATSASITLGSSATLSESGLPLDATGTVTFSSPGNSDLCSFDLPLTGCVTSTALPADLYAPISAVFADTDGGYSGSSSMSGVSLRVQSAVLPVLTITASSPTMTYGTNPPPAIMPTYGGFVDGDTAESLTTAPTCSSTVNYTSNVSTYPSTCSGAVDPNYTIVYVAGSVTVTPDAPIFSISVNGSTSATIQTDETATLTASNGLPGSLSFVSGSTILCTTYDVFGVGDSCTTSPSLALGDYQNITGVLTTGGDFKDSSSTNTVSLDVVPTVTTTITITSGCTLLDALGETDSDTQQGSCVAPLVSTTAWVVKFTSPSTVTLATGGFPTEYTLNPIVNSYGFSALPPLFGSVTIDGDGSTIVAQSPTEFGLPLPEYFRILDVSPFADVTLNNLTFSGGNEAGVGGAILNTGIVNINDCTFSGNTAFTVALLPGLGGAIYNDGSLTVTNSTFTGNHVRAGPGGGAIYNAPLATITSISNSTFSDNTADRGGAIYNDNIPSSPDPGYVPPPAQPGVINSISNSTFSGDSLSEVNNAGVIGLLSSSTFSNSPGAALLNYGTVEIQGDIFDENGVGDCVASSPITDGGYNVADDSSCGLSASTDKQNVLPSSLDLGALANNGGLTQTLAIGPTSVARQMVLAADCPATDQRGVPRPQPPSSVQGAPSYCDAGAFEYAPPVVTQISPSTATQGKLVTLTGYGFTLANAVDVYSVSLPFTIVSDTEITFTSDTGSVLSAGASTGNVTVINPDGSTRCAAGASGCHSATSTTAGGSASVADDGTSAMASGGEGTITVSDYGSIDPETTPNLSSDGEYVDVELASPNTYTSVTIVDCNLNLGDSLDWWNPAANRGAGAWQPVVGAPGPTYSTGPPPCVTVTLSSRAGPTATSPTLAQLTGTVFGVISVAQPTKLSTTLSGTGKSGASISVASGTAVSDSAALVGSNASSATGTLTYGVYSNATCTKAVSVGTPEAVTLGTLPSSSAVSLNVPGVYYWQVTYSGDANNQASKSSCGTVASGGEVETVTSVPTLQPTKLTTTLAGTGIFGGGKVWRLGQVITVFSGSAVTDSATLTGANIASAGGTVTYTVYSLVTSKKSPFTQWVQVASGGTFSMTNGSVPNSNPVTLSGGIYEWQATYSGDALNAPSSEPMSSEIETVIPVPVCKYGWNLGLNGGCKLSGSH